MFCNKNSLLGAASTLKGEALHSSLNREFLDKKLRTKMQGFKPAIFCKKHTKHL
jgi:hypothetical protein